jgi:plastocyanin
MTHRPSLLRWLATLAIGFTSGCYAADLEVRVVDGTGKPLHDAVVFLESTAAERATRPLAAFEIGQQQRQFTPQVSVIPVGSAVTFPNRDTVRHHVYSFSPTKRFEIKLYVGTPAAPVVFDKTGIAVLGCNIHDTMSAYVVIVATPWYGKTDAQGVLRLTDVPEGQYRLRAWHAAMPVGDPAHDQALRLEPRGARLQVALPSARP